VWLRSIIEHRPDVSGDLSGARRPVRQLAKLRPRFLCGDRSVDVHHVVHERNLCLFEKLAPARKCRAPSGFMGCGPPRFVRRDSEPISLCRRRFRAAASRRRGSGPTWTRALNFPPRTRATRATSQRRSRPRRRSGAVVIREKRFAGSGAPPKARNPRAMIFERWRLPAPQPSSKIDSRSRARCRLRARHGRRLK
jgi:hypothetical protein